MQFVSKNTISTKTSTSLNTNGIAEINHTHTFQISRPENRWCPLFEHTYCHVYDYKQVTSLASRVLDMIVAFGQTRHTIDSVINKLTIVCFMTRSVRPYMTQSSLVNIYYSLFHSVLSYGIVFWGQATNTKKLFILQKRVVHLMTGYGYRHLCRNLFKQLGILPLKSEYIY
jgi:hypothetical protein